MILQQRSFIITGVILITIAIILGAMGTHGLQGKITVEKMASFEVGIRYQIYHGLALLILASLFSSLKFSLKAIYIFILVGTVLFSGSIYLLALSDLFYPQLPSILWPVTPLGGLFLIISWLTFLVKLFKHKS